MNIFEKAKEIETAKQMNSRKGSAAPLADTLTIPYFKGYVRKGDKYEVSCTRTEKGKKPTKITLQAKPLSGAFILTYFSCLAYDLCKAEKQPCTIYLVQALIDSEGFSLSEYAQGKVQGSARVASHLKAIANQRGLSLSVDAKTGEIKGLDKYACDVLKAF